MSKYAPKAWQSDRFDIECPSGQLCLARKLQMEDIVALGVIDEMDLFQEFAEAPSDAAQESSASLSLMQDKERFQRITKLVDKIVSTVVIEPPLVRPVKTNSEGEEVELPASEYEDGVVYTSFVEFPDKMHIFETVFAGGTIEQFREGSSEAV